MRAAVIVALLAALALVPTTAMAAQPRASFNDVEDEVMCDTCNVPLNIAESPRADQERAVIRRLIAQGQTKDQIKAELKARYGPGILATPGDDGFDLAVWVVPIAVVGAVALLGVALVPRWRRRSPAARARPAPPLSAADARRLDEDLSRYDG